MPKKKSEKLTYLEPLKKKLESEELPRVYNLIRKQIEENAQILKNMGLENAINAIQKAIEQKESLEKLTSIESTKENQLFLTPPTSKEEKLRYIIREELEHLIKDEEQIIIEIDSKNYASFDNKEFELNSGGISILRTLSEYNQYIDVKHILKETDSYNTDESLRKGIASVNRKMLINLKLKNKIILGKRGSGYMINPLYKIRFKK